MAKPKLALIPATQGSKLYSVLPADGVGDFNFSRNSAATRINKDGLIETVASGVSRLNYPLIDGVVNGCPSHLLEPSRSNLIPYSEVYNNWNKVSLTNSSVNELNPYGTLNTQKILQISSGGFLRHLRTINGNETISVFVKKDSSDFARLWAGGNSVYFNIVNGTIESESGSQITNKSIINYGNGWFKISISVNSTSSNFRIYPATSGNSSSGINSLFVWGAQLEQGSYATSYIPTSGSAVTRSAETATGAGDASTFNDSEGVLMVEISALTNNQTNRLISLTNGSSSQRISLFYSQDSSNEVKGIVFVGGVAVGEVEYNSIDITTNLKVALKYKANDLALWINGIKVITDNLTSTPIGLDTLNFDLGISSSVLPFYGSTKQLQYFDSALNDSDLETLTSWTSFTDLANGQLYSIK